MSLMFLRSTIIVTLTTAVVACSGATEAQAPTGGLPVTSSTSPPASANGSLPLAPFCTPGAVIDYVTVGRAIFEGLTPQPAADYLSLRENVGTIPSPGLTKELQVVAERGRLCAASGDVAACKSAYEAIDPPIRLGFHYCFTRGDVAACVEDATGAIALLGDVSSLEEAFFVAEHAGYTVACDGTEATARGQARPDGSFELSVAKHIADGPCGQIQRALVHVSRDGTVLEREVTLVNASPSCP
jgi:hypothetical protein